MTSSEYAKIGRDAAKAVYHTWKALVVQQPAKNGKTLRTTDYDIMLRLVGEAILKARAAGADGRKPKGGAQPGSRSDGVGD